MEEEELEEEVGEASPLAKQKDTTPSEHLASSRPTIPDGEALTRKFILSQVCIKSINSL